MFEIVNFKGRMVQKIKHSEGNYVGISFGRNMSDDPTIQFCESSLSNYISFLHDNGEGIGAEWSPSNSVVTILSECKKDYMCPEFNRTASAHWHFPFIATHGMCWNQDAFIVPLVFNLFNGKIDAVFNELKKNADRETNDII